MALTKDKDVKLYYSIREVARLLEVNESTLRYWEREFPQIRPKTNERGVRQYTKKDIETIRVVYNQLKVRGFKIDAARRLLAANRSGADKSSQILDTLMAAREQLMALRDQLELL